MLDIRYEILDIQIQTQIQIQIQIEICCTFFVTIRIIVNIITVLQFYTQYSIFHYTTM